jgi:hypothetical protein
MRLCIAKVAILSAQDGLVLLDLRSVFSEQGSLLVHSISCACATFIQGVRSPRLPDYKRHQTCNRAWPAGVRASNAS